METYVLYKIDGKWYVYTDPATGDPYFEGDHKDIIKKIRAQNSRVDEFRTVHCNMGGW